MNKQTEHAIILAYLAGCAAICSTGIALIEYNHYSMLKSSCEAPKMPKQSISLQTPGSR